VSVILERGIVSLQHGIARLQHRTVSLRHASARMQHRTVSLQHGIARLQHGIARLQHRIASLQHGIARLQSRALLLLCLSSLFFIGPAIPGMAFALKDSQGHSIHAGIMREALGNRFSKANLAIITKSCDETIPSSGQFFFGAGKMKSSLSFVEREQKLILNYAGDADSDPRNRYRCLKHLGALLRAAQDFYSHSKYLELEAERLKRKKDKPFDPYQIELVDWSKLNDPEYKALDGNRLDDGARPMETEEEGSASIGATTYYKAARELAVRETARQWDSLCVLIKRKYKDKSITILTALREASAPEPDSLDFN